MRRPFEGPHEKRPIAAMLSVACCTAARHASACGTNVGEAIRDGGCAGACAGHKVLAGAIGHGEPLDGPVPASAVPLGFRDHEYVRDHVGRVHVADGPMTPPRPFTGTRDGERPRRTASPPEQARSWV
jgi:hypothetical protein